MNPRARVGERYVVNLSFTLGVGDRVMAKDLIDEAINGCCNQLEECHVISDFGVQCDSWDLPPDLPQDNTEMPPDKDEPGQ